jgi:hypothetical protein
MDRLAFQQFTPETVATVIPAPLDALEQPVVHGHAAMFKMALQFGASSLIVQLDPVLVEYSKTSAPAFFNAYQTAVTIVNTAGRGKVTDINENNSVPLAKAA